MKTHYVITSVFLFAVATSASAMTFTEYAHNLKTDAIHAGKKIVQVGADTGHAVVHAGKVVGGDVANGVKQSYHATTHEVKKLS
ncbi:hypothetical protein [Thiomonas sp. FB-Cd]|uniref:hypothetical protein n=1 Tax=Thiomonas sp. FB-Cd TaxID=1158292 RepID=UPI000A93FD61|nr:hypothetical protein [Thiomonas sp. FB-Cd]